MPANVNAPHRLAIVLSHPTQYYSPWFRWLRENTSLVFRVFYLCDHGIKPVQDEKFQKAFAWDIDLTSGYDWELVPNTAERPDTLRYDGLRNPELPSRLRAWQPTAILLFGYNYHTHVRLIVWARWRKIPLIFRGDSHLFGRPPARGLKRVLLSLLYRQFAAVTYVGEANRDYFRHFGVDDTRLFHAPHSVNAAHFTRTPELAERARTLRRQLGIADDTRVVLFAGKFIPQKQPTLLLRAFLDLAPVGAALVFSGDGPERGALEAEVSRTRSRSVHFLPFANQSEMPARYALADLFVLPSQGSYETWGLAINEAMHLGVPCLVSEAVGCQRDLVTDGETGWVFPSNDEHALRAKLSAALATLSTDSTTMRAAIADRISRYTYAQTSDGLLNALRHLAPQTTPHSL